MTLLDTLRLVRWIASLSRPGITDREIDQVVDTIISDDARQWWDGIVPVYSLATMGPVDLNLEQFSKLLMSEGVTRELLINETLCRSMTF